MHASPDDAQPGASGKDVSRNVTAALPAALLLPFVGVFAAIVSSAASRPRVSTSAVFAGLVALFLTGVVALTRRRRPRAAALAACHALMWAPLVAIGAWQSLDTAIVQGDVHGGCGTGLMGLLVLAVPVGGFVLFAMGIAAGAALAHRGADRALRAAAVGATGIALFAFAFAAPRMARPDPDTYLASLSVVGELRADADVQMLGRSLSYHRVSVTDPPSSEPDEGPGDPLPAHGECQLTGLAQMETFYPAGGGCPALRVRVDAKDDLAVVDSPASGRTGAASIAFHPSTGEELGISAQSVADRIGPPIGWTIGAAIGGVFGAAFLFAASRARRRAAALAGTEAQHVGNGYVTLTNGERVLVDVAAALPVGPVVLEGGKERLPTYRIMGAPTFTSARAGTLAVHRNATTDLAASLDAIAIAVAVLGAAPLVVARILGVL